MSEVITVRFALTKSDGGDPPDLSILPRDKRTVEYVRSCMSFCPDFDEFDEKIKNYEFVDDGLSEMDVEGVTIIGHPAPIIRFELTESVDTRSFLRGVWLSSYKLEIPGTNEDDPLFFEDHNGYSSVE
ncbi:uncharacterized protein METZ01_LOCUS376922 [marine metagenome]|uniref:Uncharacterized protein n=1 Tax=marine metagenome TaxID=408172 RepID=A0A382TRI3_9ZZZZ